MYNVIILGANGMLGRYLTTYFDGKCTPLTRKDLDISTAFQGDIYFKLKSLGENNVKNVVINCAGVIKARIKDHKRNKIYVINSHFPMSLGGFCEELKYDLIHITTDCIFSGRVGGYLEIDKCDVSDVYGKSKSLGEPGNCSTIRTSIIGEEINQSRSLVEWTKSQKGKEINGYTNHLWNGMTCLQFAKIVEIMIKEDLFWKGTRHLFSDIVSKFTLLTYLNEIYELDMKINKVEAESKCYRNLSSLYKPLFSIPLIYDQIKEMKEFKLK